MIRNSLGLSSMLSHGMQPCDKQPLFYRCSHWARVWDPRAGSNGSRVGSGRVVEFYRDSGKAVTQSDLLIHLL